MRSLPVNAKIVFAPDRNLGNYIQSVTGRDMVVWDGACHVREFSLEKIIELKKQYPEAKVLAHPECKKPVLLVADYVGSTAALLNYATQSDADTFIVVTEPGILHQMAKDESVETFHSGSPSDSTCGCNDCSYMKLVTLDKMYAALRDETPEVVIEESIRRRAERSIRNMLAAKR
ncbi:MAG: quinolinate synthase NadA [Alistipes indistinctus]